MNSYRYPALLLLLFAPLIPAWSQTNDGRGEPTSASAFADAEAAFDAEDFHRAVSLYLAALEDYGIASSQNASYINYRMGEALMTLGFELPFGTSDDFGQTEDYARLAETAMTDAIRLAGIDTSRPEMLVEAGEAIEAGGNRNRYLRYDLSQTWVLNRMPLRVAGNYFLRNEWRSVQDWYVQMFATRAQARSVLFETDGAMSDALAALTYRSYLSTNETLQMVYVVGSSFLTQGNQTDACQWFTQGVELAQGASGDWSGMYEMQRQTCANAQFSEGGFSTFDDSLATMEYPDTAYTEPVYGQRTVHLITASGTVWGESSAHYVDLQPGQHFRVVLTRTGGTGNAEMHVYAPGRPIERRYRLPNDSQERNVYEGRPSRRGNYQIVVSSTGGRADYSLTIHVDWL